MRLGYLAYGLDRPLSGIGRYAVSLAKALGAIDPDLSLTLLAPFSESPSGLDERYPVRRFHARLLPTLMATGPLQVAALARACKLDVVHDPFGVSPFLVPRRAGRFARVVTIHDMIPFVYPETHARMTNILFRWYIPRTLRYVDQVITVSQSAKTDITRYYGLHPDRVTVVPNGIDRDFRQADPTESRTVAAKYGIGSPYLLTVGALQPRKNLAVLFEAYRVLRQRGFEHQLVVVGKRAWKTEGIFRRLRELGLEDDVALTGYVDDDDLPALYSGAAAFAFPSLYEGFGLPPLEAMACGTPVVVSNASSLPEVVGDAGLLVAPTNVQALADALARVLTDESLQRQLVAKGLQRAARFSWDRSAVEHIEVYQQAAEKYRASERGEHGLE